MNRYWIINYLLIVVLLAAHSCGSSSTDSRKFEDSDLDKPVFQPAQPKDTSKLVGTWLTESDRAMIQYTFRSDGTFQGLRWRVYNGYWELHGDSIFMGEYKDNLDFEWKINFLTPNTLQYSYLEEFYVEKKERYEYRNVIRHAIRIPSREEPATNPNAPQSTQAQ